MNFLNIYHKAQNLTEIKDKLDQLDQLNRALVNLLPDELQNECHAGAIDYDKNILVIFTNGQQALFLLNNLSQHILNGLAKYSFYFDAVLFKVASLSLDKNNIVRYRKLDEKRKEKLTQLANYIGRNELIHEDEVRQLDEHEIKL